ncbi:MAG: ureidoglycolate lyase [Paracoccaceae bacterium]
MQVAPKPLNAKDFAPFGDVLEAAGQSDMTINQGMCERFHDRARLDFGPGGKAGVSIFQAQPRSLPHIVDMVERHPDGSQAFIPMSEDPYLVVVAQDDAGIPGIPMAFVTLPGQGINLLRGVWHGVLCPLGRSGNFIVIDRIGNTQNLEEYWYKTQIVIQSKD